MSSSEATQPEELCECSIRNDWDGDECLAENYEGLMCSRPEGHDGPHVACGMNEHPMEAWEQ